MYWWQQAAELTRTGKLKRFGLITTNSIKQTFNRRVIEQHLNPPPQPSPAGGGSKKASTQRGEVGGGLPLSLAFAIPDHPWVDAADGADVRIAMTVGTAGQKLGRLVSVVTETVGNEGEVAVSLSAREGDVHADLTVGPAVSRAIPLQANGNICFQGMNLVGKGFRLTPEEVISLGYNLQNLPLAIKPHFNARDLMQGGEQCFVIDLFGYTAEEARQQHPSLYQWLLDRVKPERDQNNRESRRRNWWLFGEPVGKLRKAWEGLSSVIITAETAKHKVFSFVSLPFCPDHKLYAFCSDDTFDLGVLSSRLHVVWALATGGRMGVGNDPVYNSTRCFLPFPFPTSTNDQKQRIRVLAEQLDSHRKRQQALHPDLTLTGMYNVLEKLRQGMPLTAKEKAIHEQGLVSVLKQLHDELDAAVADAYGWPVDLSDEEILERLVALNAERAAEEAQGLVRWLRPEYQNPQQAPHPACGHPLPTGEGQGLLPLPEGEGRGEGAAPATKAKLAWPKTLPEQVQALRATLQTAARPVTAEAIARSFQRARTEKVAELLITLVALGQAREIEPGYYTH
jgi:hypothetical protein